MNYDMSFFIKTNKKSPKLHSCEDLKSSLIYENAELENTAYKF